MQTLIPFIKANFLRFAFFSALIPGLLTSQAMGAVITWDVAPSTADLNTPTQVFTTGDFVLAGTAHPGGAVVNGITFETFGTNPDFVPTASNFNGGYTATNEYGKLVDYGSYVDLVHSPTTPYVISGLTNNQQYKIQIWVPIWNSPWPIQLGYNTNGTNTGNDQHSPTVTDGLLDGTPTQYIFGTFTATGSTQDIYAFAQSNYAGISAFELRAVPEPQTWALAALGASVILFRLRRTQRQA